MLKFVTLRILSFRDHNDEEIIYSYLYSCMQVQMQFSCMWAHLIVVLWDNTYFIGNTYFIFQIIHISLGGRKTPGCIHLNRTKSHHRNNSSQIVFQSFQNSAPGNNDGRWWKYSDLFEWLNYTTEIWVPNDHRLLVIWELRQTNQLNVFKMKQIHVPPLPPVGDVPIWDRNTRLLFIEFVSGNICFHTCIYCVVIYLQHWLL